MNAAETRASSAMADWTPLAVVSRSSTTADIETFISDVSTTRTNIAIANSTDSRERSVVLVPGIVGCSAHPRCHPFVEFRRRSTADPDGTQARRSRVYLHPGRKS